jgi:hypothetical protein
VLWLQHLNDAAPCLAGSETLISTALINIIIHEGKGKFEKAQSQNLL